MPQQKIGFYGQFQPTGVDTSQADKLRALAGISQQVGDVALQVGQKQAVAAGAKEGARIQRDEEGNVVAPELRSNLTLFGESFNKSAILANRAQIQIDSKEKLDEIQSQYASDPQGFKKVANSYMSAVTKGMPEELANIISLDMQSSIVSRSKQVNDSFFKIESDKQKAEVVKGIESGIDDLLNATRNGDVDRQSQLIAEQNAAIDAAVDARLMTAVNAEKIKESTLERITEQDALRQIDETIFNDDLSLADKVTKGIEFIDNLRGSDLKDLDPDQKDSLINVVSAKVKGLQTQMSQQSTKRSLEHSKIVSNLKIASSTGTGDQSEIATEVEELFSRGILKEGERTSILTSLAKNYKKQQDLAETDNKILEKLGGDASIVVDQKDIDSFYDRNVKDYLDDMPPELKTSAQAEFITNSRSVPSSVKQEIQNNILSGDPDLMQQSSDLIDRIDEIPGLSDLAVSTNQRAFIDSVVSLSQSLEPEQAIQLAKELTNPKDKARVEARENEIKSEKMVDSYSDDVNDAFEGFFGDDLLVNNINKESITKEYAHLFESFFKAGMTQDRAEEKAMQILQANWKDSQFGFMKYPPESFYSVGGDTRYIKKQLTSDITTGYTGFEFSKDNVFLLSDDETARKAAKGQPDYRVMVMDNNGELQVLSDRWMPDVKAETDIQLKANESLFDRDLKDSKTAKELTSQLGSIN